MTQTRESKTDPIYCCLDDRVVVVVVVYLTTNQRNVGHLSSGNGHLAGRYSNPRFKRADAIECSR